MSRANSLDRGKRERRKASLSPVGRVGKRHFVILE
jgi:hypothetical protein